MSLKLPDKPIQYFWWIRRILLLFVRLKVIPEHTLEELSLKTGDSVCYVIKNNSISDALVLEEVCRRQELPLPHSARSELGAPGSASYIYLQRIGIVQASRTDDKSPPSPLMKMVELAQSNPTMEVKIVPVSIFWGRAPAKIENSIFKLLFFDDEHAGVIQKFFIILAQGRNTFLSFGKPISLRSVVDEGAGAAETAKKIRRVVRVHFRRQRTLLTGPTLPSRTDVIASLIKTRGVKQAILDEARKQKVNYEKVETQARRYLAEISCDMKPAIMRIFEIFLSWMWHRIFEGIEFYHANRLREIDSSAEIVYLPSHRSHMDYLLLSYSLYYQGMSPPHTAAGVNLNFWPVGPLLRRVGGFYLRRSFGGNRLYTAVFNEYMHYLLTKGYSMNFFIEGGRSRTGRLLQPKTGMLTMVLQSFLRNSDRPIVFLPIYVGYDKVLEVGTYQSELRGSAKRKETIADLFKARRVLKNQFGRAYISLGEPIELSSFLDSHNPNWRTESHSQDEKPRWLSPVVHKLADKALMSVNSAAVLSPVGLVATILLAAPQRAITEEELILLLSKIIRLFKDCPDWRDISIPIQDPREILRCVMRISPIQRFHHPSGDVVYLDEADAVLLTYYRNNISHVFAIHALVACLFQHNQQFDLNKVSESCRALYPFLKFEFFLPWNLDELDAVILRVIEGFVAEGILIHDAQSGVLARPDPGSDEYFLLKMLSCILAHTIERYAICTALLIYHGDGKPFNREKYESTCMLMAQRIAILTGISAPDFFEKNLFKNYVDLLKKLDFAHEQTVGEIVLSQQVEAMAELSLKLLSAETRQSIVRASEFNQVNTQD